MAYAGLRIGEVEQLRWDDVRLEDGQPVMLHVRRGGSRGTTKDKDERFVPVHPRIVLLLGKPKKSGPVCRAVTERALLKRLKKLCARCGFEDPQQYKLHSFRHYFASLCANHQVAYRKALAWLGHSSSDMLELYYHLHDDESQRAMQQLAASAETGLSEPQPDSPIEDNLRATGGSTIEKLAEVPEFQGLVDCLAEQAERVGFEPTDLLPGQRFSRPPHSTTLAPLRECRGTLE